jgi:hypothetical protein
VLLGNDGTFRARTEYAAGAYPIALALADVTGDGMLDVLAVNEGNRSVTVLINQLPKP